MSKNGTIFTCILFFALSFSLCISSFAQKLYMNVGIGYGAGMDKDYYYLRDATFIYMEDSTNSFTQLTSEKFSMGKGLQVELGFGSFTGKHLSLELTGFYHKSSPQTIINSSYTRYYDSYELNIQDKTTFNASMIGMKPTLVVWGGDNKLRPYLKAGLVLGFASITEDEEIDLYNTNPYYYPTENILAVFEYQSQLCMGVTATAGLEIRFGDDLKLFAECSYAGMSYVPLAGEYTEYKYSGDDYLGDMSQSERYYEYVDEYDSRDNQNDNTPTKALKTAYSFSKLAFLIGIRIDLIN